MIMDSAAADVEHVLPHTPAWRLARLVTEVLAPTPVGVGALAVVVLRSTRTLAEAAKWAGLSVLFVAIIPFGYLIAQVARGRITDIHVRRREQRGAVFLVTLLSWLIGISLLYLLGSPHAIVALILIGVVALIIFGAITRRFKISLHVGVLTGLVTVFVLLFGRGALALVPLIPLVMWARVALRVHTLAQVTLGALFGCGVSAFAFAAFGRVLGI